jgi:hypothetical protein
MPPQEKDFGPDSRPRDQGADAGRPAAAPRRIQVVLMVCVIVLGAIACSGIVCWQLLAEGPFGWHVEQPRFWQGGLEALALIVALGAAQALRRRGWRVALSLLLAEVYLRRHAVDAAVLVDLLYLELAVALGALITRLCGAGRADNIVDYLRCFVLGLCAWSACAWSLSALGLGSLGDLRGLTLLLLAPALAARARPWSVFVEQRVSVMPVSARIGASVLIAWFLILFAHTATAVGYDGQWYGLRGDRVLVGAGSAFLSQGLVAAVYYYPKVYELFLVPLSGLGSSSVIAGMSIMLIGLLAAAVYELLRRLGVREMLPRLVCVGVVISLPAVANIGIEAKPDLLATLILMLAWLNAAAFVATRNRAALIWLLGLLVLSTQAKLTAIPFAGALFLSTFFAIVRHRSVPQNSATAELRLACVGAALILIVSAFAIVRTVLLAGMPTIGPDPLFKLWRALGFTLAFPAGTLRWSHPKDWADTPAVILDVLFRPQRLLPIIIMWTGNIWFWLAAVALCARALMPSPTPAVSPMDPTNAQLANRISMRWTGVGLITVAFLVMLCWGFGDRIGDGNYFIAGLIPAIVIGFAAAWPRLRTVASIQRSFLVAVCTFCLFQATYSFVSASWTGGTREFDLDFQRSPRTFLKDSRRTFSENGIARIAAQLRSLHRNARVIGCTIFGNTLGMGLPASFEDASQISFGRPEFTDSREHFIDFLKADRIEYLLVPSAQNNQVDCRAGHVLIDVAASLDNNPAVSVLRDDGYILYDISAWAK